MTVYARQYIRYSTSSKERSHVYEVYRQPRRDRLVYLAYKAWWTVSWKVKPLDRFLDKIVDPALERIHKIKCNDDCTEYTVVATGEKHPGCGRFPLTAQQDLKLYHLDHKNEEVVHHTRP